MTIKQFYEANLAATLRALQDDTMTAEQKWFLGYTQARADELRKLIAEIDNGEVENVKI